MYAKGLFAWTALLALVAASMGRGQDAAPSSDAAPTAETSPRKFALLIGASAYPQLRDDAQLLGPGNDVALTASLLRERFGYTDDDVTTLVFANEPAKQPTYENIVREFASLIDRVGDGDRVFVLLAGHGSQISNDDPDNPADKEPDGRDEAFLPQDVTPGKLGKHGPLNVIRDDQIRVWLDAIRAKGASVFFVADTCHSGTMDRGQLDKSGYSRTRWIRPAALAGMRLSNDWGNGRAVDADDDKETPAPVGLAEVVRDPNQKLAGLVALYAVDEYTREPEHPMPPDNRLDGPTYGQLTYAMNWVLARSKRELTYRELAQQIVWRYESWGWEEVSFALGSGDELDRQVLGDGMWKDRSDVMLSRDEEYSRLSINIGALHGATVGSIYTVFPPVGFENDNVPAGYVKVTEVTPTTARVVSVPYGEGPQTPAGKLPVPGRCELAFVAVSSLKLSVGVVPAGADVNAEAVAAAEAAVRAIAEMSGSLIRRADEGEEAESYIIVRGDDVFLRKRPDNGTDVTADIGDSFAEKPIDVFGPFKPDETRTSEFAQAIKTMAKAENIRRLATSEAEIYVGSAEDQSVTLTLKLQRWDAANKAWVELDRSVPISTYDQDRIRVQVFNESGEPVDVTILYIDSAFGVTSFYPTMRDVDEGGVKNRIRPGKAPAEVPFDIEATTVGLEDVIVIATIAAPDTTPQNFAFLEQEGVLRGDGDPVLNTPLGRLLGHAAFGIGERGGAAAPDIAKYVVHRLSWTVQPKDAKRP